MQKIISFLDARDSNGLFNCFSENTRNQVPELRDQINNLFEYYKGTFTDFNYDVYYGSGGSSSYNYSKAITDLEIQYTFFTTDDCYSLYLEWRIEDDYDSKNIGMSTMLIENFIGKDFRTREPASDLGITINNRK